MRWIGRIGVGHTAEQAAVPRLSFRRMSTYARVPIPTGLDGRVWPYAPRGGDQPRTMHRHDELELNLVVSGSASYLLTDRRYDLAPGTIIWLFPGQDHVLVNDRPDFAMWIAVFGRPLVLDACRTDQTRTLRSDRPIGSFCRRARPDDFEALRRLVAEMRDRVSEPDFYNAALRYLMMQAWTATGRAEQTTVGRDVHPAVERAARRLRDEPAEALDAVADHAGLSPARLSRLFKQQTGESITDYRNRRRLDRFFELHRAGRDRTMLDTALAAGFGSYAQFHRVFKREMGCSPAAFRRRLDRG